MGMVWKRRTTKEKESAVMVITTTTLKKDNCKVSISSREDRELFYLQ